MRIQLERHDGAVRLSLFLKRCHQVSISAPTIFRLFREPKVPRVSLKQRCVSLPRRRPEVCSPCQSVQVDVTHLKLASGRLYQFTAIDEATRFRILKIYDHNTIKSAIHFIDEVRHHLPFAI